MVARRFGVCMGGARKDARKKVSIESILERLESYRRLKEFYGGLRAWLK